MAIVADRSATASRERQAWGATVTVQVLERDLPAGALVAPSDLGAASWPAALAPPGAVVDLADGRRLTAAVARGEVLVEHRLATPDTGAIGALLERGEVAVRVPLGDPPASVEPGDLVDVVAPSDRVEPDGFSATLVVEPVARSARVLAVADDAATLAVPRASAVGTAGAALGGMVALIVVR
jgi:Flp pilus assembly protein CpaB